MSKIKDAGEQNGQRLWAFHCPGCGYDHSFEVPRWTWNGSIDAPSFNPSLMVNQDHPEQRCHLLMVDGQIKFEADCFHGLGGKTVECPEWDVSPEIVKAPVAAEKTDYPSSAKVPFLKLRREE